MRGFFPKALVTPTERAFWQRLREAAPEFEVCPQVCLGALIQPQSGLINLRDRRAARRPYAALMVDFVLYDASAGRVVCLVELDDHTHDGNGARDAQRDLMTARAGFYTLRWDARQQPSVQELRKRILETSQLGPHPESNQTEKKSMARRRQSPGELIAEIIVIAIVALVVIPWFFRSMAADNQKAVQKVRQTHAAAQEKREQERLAAFKSTLHTVKVPPRGSATIKAHGCIAYGDAQALARDAAQCVPVEDVSFVIKDNNTLPEWVSFNKDRLLPSALCADYKGWADELLHASDTDAAEKAQSLHNLFSDALSKGCLKAPWATR